MENTINAANEDLSVLSAFAKSGASAGSDAAPASTPFGKYALTRSIGRGGFGEVFLAVHETTWNRVAVKVLSKRKRADAAASTRFELEIRVGKELRHPNVLPVIDDGEINGVRYFATPFIEGEDLLHRLAKKPMAITEAVRTMRLVAEAVSAAHARGYLHRDIKPANILIDNKSGNPLVADFGLAKDVGSSTPNTETLAVLGTQAYMPPEQVDPNLGDFSAATDIYAIGVTLYQCLTGRTPFPRKDNPNRDILLQIAWDRPQPPSAFNSRIPPDLDRICLICLQKSPFDRYTSADELAADLARFEDGKPIRAKLPSTTKQFYRACKRHPRMSVALALSLCLAVSGGAIARRYATQAFDFAGQLVGAEVGKKVATEQRQFQEYVSDMKEAAMLWRSGNAEMLRRVLDRHASSVPDQRGFEWDYWNRLLTQSSQTMGESFSANSLAISGDGRLLAGADEKSAALFDTRTGKLLYRWDIGSGTPAEERLPRETPWPQNVAFSPDGKLVAAVCAVVEQKKRFGHLRVWNTTDGNERLKILHDERLGGATVTFSQDNIHVVAGGYSNRWYSWIVSSGQVGPSPSARTLQEKDMLGMRRDEPDARKSEDRVTDLRWENGCIMTAGIRGEARLWTWPDGVGRTDDWYPLGKSGGFPITPWSTRHVVGLDEGYVIIFDDFDASLNARRIGSRPPPQRQSNRSTRTLCLALDGTMMATGDEDRIVRYWRLQESDHTAVSMHDLRGNTDEIRCVAVGGRMVASADSAGTIRVWPLDDQFSEGIILPPSAEKDDAPATSSTGRFTTRASKDSLQIEDRTGEVVAQIPTGRELVTKMVFSPNDQFIAMCLHRPLTPRNYRRNLGGPRLVIWQLDPSRQIYASRVPRESVVVPLSFSHDGHLLAIPNEMAGVSLMHLPEGSERTIARDWNASIAELSPSGRYIAISGEKGTGVLELQSEQWLFKSNESAHGAKFESGEDGEHRVILLGKTVTVVDLPSGKGVPTLLSNLPAGCTEFSRDGRRLFVWEPQHLRIFALAANSNDGTLLLDVPCMESEIPTSGYESALLRLTDTWKAKRVQLHR